jgi:hypothetical protein
MVRALVASALCLAIASCAARGKAGTAAAPEASAAATSPMPASPREQIDEFDRQIEAERAQLQLEPPSDPQIQSAPTQPMGALPAQQDPKCKPAKTETCETSCRLSDSICGNAEKICKLAQELPGDAWAANKCAKANTTCEASRTKCCSCQ